jgi:hypothetical protein
VLEMAKKLECPYGIPEDQCCKEKECPVWKRRVKTREKTKTKRLRKVQAK